MPDHPNSRDVEDAVDRGLRQVAGWMLPGAPEIDPVDVTAEPDLVDRARSHMVLGPLFAVVQAGGLSLTPDVVTSLRVAHEQAMWWCLRVETHLLRVRRWLSDEGVGPFLVVKGPAVAHLDDVDPSLRAFADLDLLVRSTDLDRVVKLLVANGGQRVVPERRPGFDRRFMKSVTVRGPDGVEVDLHRTLCDGTHGFRVPVERIFSQATALRIGGHELLAPGLTHRALHAAYHAVLGSAVAPLRTVRDLAHYLVDPRLGPEVLAEEAERWNGTAVLAQAVRETFETLEFEAPGWQKWLDATPVDPAEARIVARQRVESGSFGWSKLVALREVGWADRAAYLIGVGFPSGEHLRARGLGRASHVRALPRRLRQSAGGTSRPAG